MKKEKGIKKSITISKQNNKHIKDNSIKATKLINWLLEQHFGKEIKSEK